MSFLFKLMLVALLHFALFVCYPETGPNWSVYLVVSILAWTGFFFGLSANLAFVRLISGALGLLFDLVFFALMLAVLALTMPQLDKVSVLKKVQKKQFPDGNSVSLGLKKFGIGSGGPVKKEIEKLDPAIDKVVDKFKEARGSR